MKRRGENSFFSNIMFKKKGFKCLRYSIDVRYVLDTLQRSNYSIVFNRVVMSLIHGLGTFICGGMDKRRFHV